MAKFMTGLDKVTSEWLHKELKITGKIGDIVCHLGTYEDVPQAQDSYIMLLQHSEPSF